MASLAGVWVLPNGTEGFDISDILDAPLTLKLKNESKQDKLLISFVIKGVIEEITFCLKTKNEKLIQIYQLCSLNYEKKGLLSAVTHVNYNFSELFVLRLGPTKNQRSFTKRLFIGY
jgi:hypothetical protein